MELSELPDEMVVEICTKLSDVELDKLGKTSAKNFRICQEILSKREETEYEEVLSLLHALETYFYNDIILTTNDTNRIISIKQWQGGISREDNKILGKFIVQEKLKKIDESILSRLELVSKVLIINSDIDRKVLIYLLGYMLRNGEWNGKFKIRI